VIARVWFGRTSADDLEAYTDYLQETGVPELASTEGNQGVYVLRRVDEDDAEFVVLSLWDSMQSVERFAGPEPDRARYYPEDERFLRELTPNLDHYEVAWPKADSD
jgi:heme-degrading monooxygenase HmoA